MDPLDALNAVVFRLERSGADTYKVRAFRHAARAVATMAPEDLAELAAAGRLQSIEGVGKSTAQVIAEALQGQVPAYLTKLDQELGADDDLMVDGSAAELLGSLRGDCHSHSDWSDGGSPIIEMAESARGLGREYLVLTDHSARLTVAHGLNEERLRQQLEVLADLNARSGALPHPVRHGGGHPRGRCPRPRSRTPRPARRRRGQCAFEVADGRRPHDGAHAGGHREPAHRHPRPLHGPPHHGPGRPQSAFDHDAVFSACARTGTAVEINSRPERQDPPQDLLSRAVELGCTFAIDTDAHAPGQLEWLGRGCRNAVTAGVPFERVVNSKSADDLVAWAADHGKAAA